MTLVFHIQIQKRRAVDSVADVNMSASSFRFRSREYSLDGTAAARSINDNAIGAVTAHAVESWFANGQCRS